MPCWLSLHSPGAEHRQLAGWEAVEAAHACCGACSCFSPHTASTQAVSSAQPARSLHQLAAVVVLQPEFVVIENVAGLLCCDGMMECIVLALASLGYQVRWRLVNCGSYGVATVGHAAAVSVTALCGM